jgi:hypothetical protein
MALSIAILTVGSVYWEGGPIGEAWRRDRLHRLLPVKSNTHTWKAGLSRSDETASDSRDWLA